MTLAAELADRAHALVAGPIPDRVYRAASAHLTDTVGAVIAGHTTLREPVRRLTEGLGLTGGPRRTAFEAGVYAGGWEVAGIHRGAVLCPGCVVLPAVLAALDMCPDVSWQHVQRAYLAGYQVAIGAALAVGGDRLIAQGWWPTALLGPLGGAAAGSVLLGGQVAQTASAIALAAQHAGGVVAGDTVDADGRYLLSGLAAQRAIGAVLAVRAGWRGPMDVLDDPRSPLRCQAAIPDSYLLPETSIKAHSGAKHVHAAIDAIGALDGTLDGALRDAEVLDLTCALPAALVKTVDRPPPFGSPLHAMASAQFMLAVTVVRGHCSPWEFQPELLEDSRVLALASRIRLVADVELSAAYPARWGARLRVHTTSGTFNVRRDAARGDPGHELTSDELVDKFVTLAGRSLGDERARDMAGRLLGAEPAAPAALLTDQLLPLLRGSAVFQGT